MAALNIADLLADGAKTADELAPLASVLLSTERVVCLLLLLCRLPRRCFVQHSSLEQNVCTCSGLDPALELTLLYGRRGVWGRPLAGPAAGRGAGRAGCANKQGGHHPFPQQRAVGDAARLAPSLCQVTSSFALASACCCMVSLISFCKSRLRCLDVESMSLCIGRLFTQGASVNAAKLISILPDAPSVAVRPVLFAGSSSSCRGRN